MKNFMEVPTYINSLRMTKIIAPGYLDYKKTRLCFILKARRLPMKQLKTIIESKLERLERLGMSTSTAVISIDRLIYDILSKIITKELNIDMPNISIKELDPNEWGQYRRDNDTVVLNILLSPASYILTDKLGEALKHISTLAHELRHKYQYEYNESILDNYIQPEDNMKAYKEQASEFDACNYQHEWLVNNKQLIIDTLVSNL